MGRQHDSGNRREKSSIIFAEVALSGTTKLYKANPNMDMQAW